jgi:diguanylate cyclase (GGDEF)-like protein
MEQTSHPSGMGAPIVAGFFAALVLMASLSVIGLRYIADANQRLQTITQNNNVKTELATVMQSSLRERALSMHALSILTDAFEKDAEIQRFNSYGAKYIKAREELEAMPLTRQESEILARIRELTREAQPQVQSVVEMATFEEDQSAIFERIRNVAMPRQRAIADQVNELISLQREQTAGAVRRASESYVEVRGLMFALGLLAVSLGGTIAYFVSRRVTSQAKQLASQAMYDPLTGLANRALLQNRLEHEINKSRRAHTPFGVALMDLDRFKEVNDTLGHDVGDELLREVGRRLKEQVRTGDTVARLGGDEYVILLHEVNEKNLPVVAQKILQALDKPFHWGDQSIDLGASLGVSLYPVHGDNPGSLVRCADIAMYTAKRARKGYVLYAPEQERTTLSDLSLKSELREAIQQNQLVLHYQPKIDHRTRLVAGLEALVRWNHPQRGFLSPDKFVPLAEEEGLIGALTNWVLETSLAELAGLHAQGWRLGMAVNLSARSLHDMNLPAAISAALEQSGVSAADLTLEITESAVMANPSDGLAILTELDRIGVTLAIDDFGTGHSSLAYLKRLPVDELKIDKSFVMDMEADDHDAVIVRSTIELAHNLGLKVTAEGVETEDAWDTLTVLGCDRSQGFLMSRPLPAKELSTWLRESRWALPPNQVHPFSGPRLAPHIGA